MKHVDPTRPVATGAKRDAPKREPKHKAPSRIVRLGSKGAS